MKVLCFVLILFSNVLFADSIISLLKEYESTSENSLKTVNEKLGHVIVYSQKEIRQMQYTKLSDILKELPLMSLSKNTYGLTSPLLAGSKSVSGFFRFFINDHEISSSFNQSPSLTWGDLPLDLVNHIEIYYGDSSFTLGNETGVYFIRIYTKSAKQENGNELRSVFQSNGAKTQSLTHSQSFANGWSYLLYLNNEKLKDKSEYNNSSLKNNSDRKYLYLNISNETTNVNIGYTGLNKDNFVGLSLDGLPDSGEIKSKDYFIDFTQYFLDDKSIKAKFAIDINEREYEENNAGGIGLLPVLDLMGTTIPKQFNEDLKFTKTNAYISKTFKYENNNILTALNVTNKKYKVKERKSLNFLNTQTNVGYYNDFNEETVYSLLFQNDYKVNDKLILLANAKIDKYKRNSYIKDSTEQLFRVGLIYTPFEYLGFKSFYTDTYLPPSFYNSDFVDITRNTITSQKYKFFTLEGVYTRGNSKFGMIYNNVKIDDFIYLSPIGFTNIDHRIETEGLIFNYDYEFSNKNKLHLNYYISSQNDNVSNSQKGGYIKYTGSYNKFEYFTSLIYKSSFNYYNVNIKDSFDLSLGATYNFTKDFSCSIKGENLLKKSTQSLYSYGISPVTNYSLKDNVERSFYFSLKWVF